MRRLAAAAGILLMAGAHAVLGTGSAQAATTMTTTRPSTPILLGSLHLTVTDAAGVVTTADLNCVRGRNVYGKTYVSGNGTVANPMAACQELDAVSGDPTQLDVHPTWLADTLIAPTTATATGFWGSSYLDFSHTYTNKGDLTKLTGDVFAF